MNEPWQAAELLEAIIRNANPASVYLRIDDLMWGKTKSEFVATTISTDEITGVVEAIYEFPESDIMSNVTGTAEEVIDWLRTGLTSGQEVWLTARDSDGYRRLAIKQRYVDHGMARSLNILLQNSLEQKAAGNSIRPRRLLANA
jgi:hypothetical protein